MKLRATWNGAVLAESDDVVRLEGNAYFPPDSLHSEGRVAFWGGVQVEAVDEPV